MAISQLTVFGAGLIGGSVALAARKRGLATRIAAVDTANEPADPRAFDTWLKRDNIEAIEELLGRTDLAVLCTPVQAITDMLPSVLTHTSGVVTDCGSTKAAIVAVAQKHKDGARFVPGHPMAGHPEGGLKNARDDLFVGRKWILCPQTGGDAATETVRSFASDLGAVPMDLTAIEHDRSVAVTSHLPQVIASALSVFAEEENAKQAAGPGFASATRVAGGADAMWRDIFWTNADTIGSALEDLGAELQKLGKQLNQNDVEGALKLLEKARKLRGDQG